MQDIGVQSRAGAVDMHEFLQAVELYTSLLQAGKQKVNVVLMDFHMPRMSGMDAIVEMRRVEAKFNAPRVAIAAYTAGENHIPSVAGGIACSVF
jgi:CheY-like chemotaxis protein